MIWLIPIVTVHILVIYYILKVNMIDKDPVFVDNRLKHFIDQFFR